MVAVVEAVTVRVVTLKAAPVAPAGTVTLAGTVATAELLLERATTAPPLRAGPLSVTLPVALSMLPYTETIVTDEPEVTHDTPTPCKPPETL